MEKHRPSVYTSGHWVKASVVDPTRTSLIDAIGTEREKGVVELACFETSEM